jgi:hypothetical protein
MMKNGGLVKYSAPRSINSLDYLKTGRQATAFKPTPLDRFSKTFRLQLMNPMPLRQ